MSGWTNITLEPIGSEGGELHRPEREDLKKLEKLTRNISETHTKETLKESLKDTEEKVQELLLDMGVGISVEYQIIEYIKYNFSHPSGRLIINKDPPTFRYYHQPTQSRRTKSLIETIFEECEFVGRILVISANDTNESGEGTLYKRNEEHIDGWVKVKHKDGYERAKGQDVVEWFREIYNIRGTASR